VDVHTLRARWRSATTAAGWAFADDWALPEVDTVCAAVLGPGDPGAALTALGGARARCGCGLGETLLDLAALHAVLRAPAGSAEPAPADVDATPAPMLRATALGWADVVAGRASAVESVDPLTGLPTASYLRTRLGEVYRAEEAADRALVLVRLDVPRTSGWSAVVALTLLADVLREVFDGGETIAALNRTTAVVLAGRDDALERRAGTLARLAGHRLAVDPHLRLVGTPVVWLERLPGTYDEARDLLAAHVR
jgi:GGDEF domain-containing protein